MIEVSQDRFFELVESAFAALPDALKDLLDNVVLFVEEHPPSGEPDLLGLYDGIPLTERDSTYAGVLPDRITVFRQPTLAMCDSEQQVIDEIGITVAHEIAHHFGIDDARLHELGYA